MPTIEKQLERRTREALIKVDERVARISKMAVVEKSKKMQQRLIEVVDRGDSNNAEKPAFKMLQRLQRTLSKVGEGVRHLARLPCASASQRTETEDSGTVHAKLKGGGHSPAEEPHDTAASALKDGGDGPRVLDAAPLDRALRMDMASCFIPHHDEDAFFCHPEAGVVGVADGVGGYRKRGVDAGAFARALMGNAFAEARRPFTDEGSSGTAVCPYTLLRSAHEVAARSSTPGASTAVIVSLDGAILRWACVGDSAFAVLRGGRIVHRSKPQQHRFNCPYQLSATGADRVADADVGGVPVMGGDVVVIGTDGLFDNVFGTELEQIVRKGTELGASPQNMADHIAGTACEVSFGWLAHSPTTCSAKSWRDDEEGAERFYGGKVDDITVVVAFIVSSI